MKNMFEGLKKIILRQDSENPTEKDRELTMARLSESLSAGVKNELPEESEEHIANRMSLEALEKKLLELQKTEEIILTTRQGSGPRPIGDAPILEKLEREIVETNEKIMALKHRNIL